MRKGGLSLPRSCFRLRLLSLQLAHASCVIPASSAMVSREALENARQVPATPAPGAAALQGAFAASAPHVLGRTSQSMTMPATLSALAQGLLRIQGAPGKPGVVPRKIGHSGLGLAAGVDVRAVQGPARHAPEAAHQPGAFLRILHARSHWCRGEGCRAPTPRMQFLGAAGALLSPAMQQQQLGRLSGV